MQECYELAAYADGAKLATASDTVANVGTILFTLV